MPIKKIKKVRVVLYVPQEINDFLEDCTNRVITVRGHKLKFEKSISEVYLEFLKMGISSLEDKDDQE